MTGKKLKSDIAWSTADRIVVRGHDLVEELLGKASLGDVAFLELKGRLPTKQESTVFNALAVTLVEHGMTPSEFDTFGATLRTLRQFLAANADLEALVRDVVVPSP